nr:multidrug effflux MFS transporter [Rhodoferax sp.]
MTTSHGLASSSARSAMSPALIVLTLALLLGIQPITTDLYLPALPGLTQELGASMASAQLTLTALLLAFGVSQLFWGPLSDRLGRRPVLLIGMAAYVLASLGSAFSASMDLLIVWRAVQGAAMGAAVMCARAIVRDLYTPVQGASVMSKGLSGLGVIACLSAPLGGLLTALFNWHAALLALSVFGAVSLGLIALRFEETIPARNPHALQFGTLLRTWMVIVRNPTFLAFTALSTFAYSGLFTFLASSSFVFIRVLGLSATQYGMVMFANSFIYMLGTFLCRRLLLRFGVRRAVAVAGVLTLTGGGLVAALAFAGAQSVWAIELPFALFMLAHGIHNPCGQSGAVGPFPQAAGAASALNGFLAMVSAFGTGQWLGRHMDGTTGPLAMGILFWSVMITLTAWTLVQRHGKS